MKPKREDLIKNMYYRVKYEGVWHIAIWVDDHFCNDTLYEFYSEIDEIHPEPLNPTPKGK